eukprot:12799-Heterococcus_DN1.PRE.2
MSTQKKHCQCMQRQVRAVSLRCRIKVVLLNQLTARQLQCCCSVLQPTWHCYRWLLVTAAGYYYCMPRHSASATTLLTVTLAVGAASPLATAAASSHYGHVLLLAGMTYAAVAAVAAARMHDWTQYCIKRLLLSLACCSLCNSRASYVGAAEDSTE